MTDELERRIARLKPGDHVCQIYDNAAQRVAAIVAFFKEGFARNERCVFGTGDDSRDEVTRALGAAGVDVDRRLRERALDFWLLPGTYLPEARFDPLAMIELLRLTERQALADGLSGLRFVGEMSWSLGPEPGCEPLIEFEALLNPAFREGHSTFLCQYDSSRVDVRCMHDVLRTHPVTILADQVCKNPHYEPPELVLDPQPPNTPQFLARRVDWWTDQLKQAAASEQGRERLVELLEAQSAQFRAFLAHSPTISFIKDASGRILFISDRIRETLGRAPEEVVGKTASDVFPADVAERLAKADAAVLAKGVPVETVEALPDARGGLRQWLVVKFPYRGFADQPLLGAVGVDITEGKLVEAKLQQSERMLAEAQRVAHIGSVELDLRTDKFTCSDELYRLFGLDPQNRVTSLKEFRSLLQPQDAELCRGLVDQVVRERRPFASDHAVVLPDGRSRVVDHRGDVVLDDQGEPVRFIGTLQDVTEIREAERERERYTARLQALSHRLLEVQEAERRHLALELHDEVGQMLTALSLRLNPRGNLTEETARARFEDAREIVDRLIEQVRGLSFALRPAALDHLGLVAALLALFEWYTERTGVTVRFEHTGLEERFAHEVETAAYRIVQEALTNTARHSEVDAAIVRAWADGDTVRVQVEDRGRGFEPEIAMAKYRSTGLRGMHERALLLGGNLTIDSRPGHGTQITAELPRGGLPEACED